MSALSDLQKKLEQEAQGIMFPFSANANTVSTTQNVYDSATDGIMTMQGQKYIGPDAVIQYGTEEQEYQRQLKQIEAPMLPQFDADQFPKAGEGIVETPTPAPTPPVETEPETPAVDPCPPGFKYDPVKKMCVPIEQPKSDTPEEIKPPRVPNQFESSLNGYLRHEEIKQAIDGSLYDVGVVGQSIENDINMQRIGDVERPDIEPKQNTLQFLRDQLAKTELGSDKARELGADIKKLEKEIANDIRILNQSPVTSVVGGADAEGKIQPGGTAGYVMGTAGSDPILGLTNEQKTFNIDVSKEMNTANMDAAIGSILGSIFGGPAIGTAVGGFLRKNYSNTLIGQLNGLADFGILEKPADGFKIDTEGGILGVGGKSFINNITTTNVAKNKIRQLISQATPEYNKEVRQQLGSEYLDKTKEYQRALFKSGNRSLMEGVSDAERRQIAELDRQAGVTTPRTTQGGFGGFEAFEKYKRGEITREQFLGKGKTTEEGKSEAREKAEKVAEEYAKKDKLAVDNSWKNNYNWSGPNNTGEMLSEKKQSGASGGSGQNRGSGSGTGKSRVICTELHSTKELSTKDWIRDTQFTFKHLSKTHVKGYLAWAIPTVKHIQKYKLYRKVWKHIAQHRANDIAWRMKQGKFDLLGRIYAGIGEPLCWVIGNFVSDYNLNKLGVNRQWQK